MLVPPGDQDLQYSHQSDLSFHRKHVHNVILYTMWHVNGSKSTVLYPILGMSLA